MFVNHLSLFCDSLQVLTSKLLNTTGFFICKKYHATEPRGLAIFRRHVSTLTIPPAPCGRRVGTLWASCDSRTFSPPGSVPAAGTTGVPDGLPRLTWDSSQVAVRRGATSDMDASSPTLHPLLFSVAAAAGVSLCACCRRCSRRRDRLGRLPPRPSPLFLPDPGLSACSKRLRLP